MAKKKSKKTLGVADEKFAGDTLYVGPDPTPVAVVTSPLPEVLKCLRTLADFSTDPLQHRRAQKSAEARKQAYELLKKYD